MALKKGEGIGVRVRRLTGEIIYPLTRKERGFRFWDFGGPEDNVEKAFVEANPNRGMVIVSSNRAAMGEVEDVSSAPPAPLADLHPRAVGHNIAVLFLGQRVSLGFGGRQVVVEADRSKRRKRGKRA